MNYKIFTATQLKLIALAAMFIDHLATVFISHDTFWGMALRVPGRIVAPIMCYMISEGFFYTKDKKKYLGRLLLFALISHIPYNLCMGTRFPTTSVMWSLAMGLAALTIAKNTNISLITKSFAILFCCALSYYANWNFVAVLWIVFFGIFRGDFKKQILSFSLIGFFLHIIPIFTYLDFGFSHELPHWYQLFIFAAIPLLMLYNGKKGNSSKQMTQFFYLFYPAHLLLISLMNTIL